MNFNISVIIPVYNAEMYLEKAVHSALEHEEVKEIILVEDASPDNALLICHKLAHQYEKVKLYTHPNNENRGAGASRNLGIEKASQEYIAFLDADDFYLPNRFNKDKEVFENNPEADGVYNAIGVHFYSEIGKKQFCETFYVDPLKATDYLTTVSQYIEPNELFKSLLRFYEKRKGYFHLDGFTIKKSALDKITPHFNSLLRLHQDTEFLYRLAYYCKLYSANISEAVAKRGVHEDNRITSAQHSNKIKSRILLYQTFYNWSITENLEIEVQDKFRFTLLKFEFMQVNGIRKMMLFAKSLVFQKRFFTSPFSNEIHYNMFENKKIQNIYSKIYFKLFRKSNK